MRYLFSAILIITSTNIGVAQNINKIKEFRINVLKTLKFC